MSALPEHHCTSSLLQVFGERHKESRKGWGLGYTREKERYKGPEAISWVDVRQLTVNILGSDYKTRANDSPMISLPNNLLHVSPSATFFPFSSIFIAPLPFPSSSSPQRFVTAVS